MCPSSLLHKRAMAAESCGKRIKTACTTKFLHFHLGETGDPAIWFPLGQLRTWLELPCEDVEHKLNKIDVARAWAAAAGNMRKDSRWSMVLGPLTARIATLRDMNIIPATPWKWYPADPGPFLREMQQRLSRKAWRQPAHHHHGKGTEKRCGHDGSAQKPQTVGHTRCTHQGWCVLQTCHSTDPRRPKSLRTQRC